MTSQRTITSALRATIALCIALAAPAAIAAGKPMQVLEQAFEGTTDSVRLPERVGTSITLAGCAKRCPANVLVTEGTRYFIGKREVTLADMRKKLAAATADVTLFYDPKTNVVTRIKTY